MKSITRLIAALALLITSTAFAQFDHSHKAFDDHQEARHLHQQRQRLAGVVRGLRA